MFIDEAKIFVKAGAGGSGAASFHREKYRPHGGPDGGSGGHGGSIILVASRDVNTLVEFSFQKHFSARRGAHGSGNNRHGADAQDVRIKVPMGTQVRDEEGELLADLANEGQEVVIARGGIGGRGNAAFATPAFKNPTFAEKGEPGEERFLHMELKLLADIAVVGMPNVGKSSLIAHISAARPRIADYPFTTLEPHLGVVRVEEDSSFVIEDIPGLIEDAHLGKGLGIRFLRHVERAKMILHILDISGAQGDPVHDFEVIDGELFHYSETLHAKRTIIAGNKLDIASPEEVERVREHMEGLGYEFFPISAVTGEGLRPLVFRLHAVLQELEAEWEREKRVPPAGERMVFTYEPPPKRDFTVEHQGDYWLVRGPSVERVVAMTDLDNDQAVSHLQGRLKAMGVDEELEKAGAQVGDVVVIGEASFDYAPG